MGPLALAKASYLTTLNVCVVDYISRVFIRGRVKVVCYVNGIERELHLPSFLSPPNAKLFSEDGSVIAWMESTPMHLLCDFDKECLRNILDPRGSLKSPTCTMMVLVPWRDTCPICFLSSPPSPPSSHAAGSSSHAAGPSSHAAGSSSHSAQSPSEYAHSLNGSLESNESVDDMSFPQVLLPCSHLMCLLCHDTWYRTTIRSNREPHCPMCRAEYTLIESPLV